MPNNYYSLALGHGWRLVVLDTTEMSLHSGLPEDSEGVQQARAWLVARPKQQHPNAEPWNGGCTAQQLTWLRQTLATAAVQGEQVLVACHHPVVAGSARRRYLAWGHEQLQAAFDAHTRVVRCVFSGHYHPGGYMCAAGIHYVVYQGVLEAPPDSNAYAVVEVHADRLVVAGRGVGASMVLPL
jgi:3',5'-cyclic AMP phosphodiesterase CpdA